MKTFIAALAAATAVTAVAAPAIAQPYRGHDRHYDRGYDSARVNSAEQRIESGLRNGELNRREANRLNAEIREFSRIENRYRAGGLTRWERTDLDRRYSVLIAQMRAELYDNNRQYGYGYGQRR